ncbi:hypothetical protein, variant 4 [Cryptococcus amylolentus CBS 6039]|nr:hypothetical protein, variant 4 [Cryptococcus amylolentus CBS 6039]ODN76160.1 hypothetical protein, variant 4 [Cryptococcus amylolentus CBS 6039]
MPCFLKDPLMASHLLVSPMPLGVSMLGRKHHLQQVGLEESEAPFWPVHGECQSGFFAGFSGSIFRPNTSNDGGWDSQERLPDGQPVVPSLEREGAFQFCVKKRLRAKCAILNLEFHPMCW